jgi:alpha/beta superfamily hydrolase
VQRFDFTQLPPPRCPWLVIQGDLDEVVDYNAVVEWARSLSPAPDLVVLPGVGHFFHGRLHELKEAVVNHVQGAAADSP